MTTKLPKITEVRTQIINTLLKQIGFIDRQAAKECDAGKLLLLVQAEEVLARTICRTLGGYWPVDEQDWPEGVSEDDPDQEDPERKRAMETLKEMGFYR